MASRNLFTEEGRTRWRNFERRLWSYLFLFLMLAVFTGVLVFLRWTRAGMGPLQRMYLRQYLIAEVKADLLSNSHRNYVLLLSAWKDKSGAIGVTDALVYPVKDSSGRPVRDQYGWAFRPYSDAKVAQPYWKVVRLSDHEMNAWFRQNIYEGQSLWRLLLPSFIAGLAALLGGGILAVVIDQRLNRNYEHGRLIRGTRLAQPKAYERQNKGAQGLGLGVRSRQPEGSLTKLKRKLIGGSEPVHRLRMKRDEELQGMLILGDIGSGKSQIIHRYLKQIASRSPREAAIIYDPACEFVKAHYNPRRGDVILNPLDDRSPFWSPTFDLKYRTDYGLLAEIFFPGRKSELMHQTESFFINSSRDIFARMLEHKPHPAQLVEWLADAKEIDRMVKGTELAHYIDAKAANQRGGVLGSLSRVGRTLRLLPSVQQCEFEFSLSEWAEERGGWLFLTSTKETEEQLRPLYAAYLDLLMRRVMSVDEAWGRQHPCWMIVDEVHTLGYLPSLYKAATEGRKFGLKLVQGTQNKHQYDEHYGRGAPTMLSCPRHAIILRCREPESAKWLSDVIGESEWEKPRVGTTASVSDNGRDSIHYSTMTERRAVVSREEIAALPDLEGYWKYGDQVVPFRLDYRRLNRQAEGFMARPYRSSQPVSLPPEPSDSNNRDASTDLEQPKKERSKKAEKDEATTTETSQPDTVIGKAPPGGVSLSVRLRDKDEVKELGAKWDPDDKVWYVPKGVRLEPFSRWIPAETGRLITAQSDATEEPAGDADVVDESMQRESISSRSSDDTTHSEWSDEVDPNTPGEVDSSEEPAQKEFEDRLKLPRYALPAHVVEQAPNELSPVDTSESFQHDETGF